MARSDTGFIARHGLWSDDQARLADEVVKRIEAEGLTSVRVIWGDQHGIARGKTLSIAEFRSSLRNGKDFQLVMSLFDTTSHPIVPPFAASNALNLPKMVGLPDGVLVPDPGTFTVLPWAKGMGWCLCDIYFGDGTAHPLGTRQILRDQLAKLASDGLTMTIGLEFECHVFKMEDPRLAPEDCTHPPRPPAVSMITHGYQYMSEKSYDELDGLITMFRENLDGLGMPLATFEIEWGPGQMEVTFDPRDAMTAADNALLYRTAVKQFCARNGYHASFMAVPNIPNTFPVGWHLHQSLGDTSGNNAFTTDQEPGPFSPRGMAWMGGLLHHARETALLTTPTVTGYKRLRPNTFAPVSASWARENRGAMLRILGGIGDQNARIENRIGDPAANSYLYIASQIIAGRAGLAENRDPGEPVRAGYDDVRPPLPRSLMEAVPAFKESALMKRELGEVFHHYLTLMKEFEVDRFLSAVTDWEHNEYFEMF